VTHSNKEEIKATIVSSCLFYSQAKGLIDQCHFRIDDTKMKCKILLVVLQSKGDLPSELLNKVKFRIFMFIFKYTT
jgi:hypothetical protein